MPGNSIHLSCNLCGLAEGLLKPHITKKGTFRFCLPCVREAFRLIFDSNEESTARTENCVLVKNRPCTYCNMAAVRNDFVVEHKSGAWLCYVCLFEFGFVRIRASDVYPDQRTVN